MSQKTIPQITNKGVYIMKKLVPHLWFNKEAEEASKFYFENEKI